MDLAYHIANELGGAKKISNGWQCRCPLHDDKTASLSIGKGDKQEVVLKCHAGCDQRELFNYIKDAGYLPELKKEEKPVYTGIKKEIAVYPYTDEHGVLLFEKVRYEPKTFSSRHYDSEGHMVAGSNGHSKSLYMRHSLNDIKDKTVIITEGEKDCDFIIKNYGYICTSPPNGATSWRDDFNQIFIGADVVICPDNDAPGQNFALEVASKLGIFAKSIKTIKIPTGKDVSDWSGSKEDFDALVIDDVKLKITFSSADEMADTATAPVFFINNVLEQDSHGMLAGSSGAYKSFMVLNMAHSICTGGMFFGNQCFDTGKVLYFCGEGESALKRRMKALKIVCGGFGDNLLVSDVRVRIDSEDDVRDISLAIQQIRPALVIFDTFSSMNSRTNENDNSDVSKALSFLKSHVSNGYTSSIIVHHYGKDSERGVRGASAFKDNSDFIFTMKRTDKETMQTTLSCEKLKDGEPFNDISAMARVVELGFQGQDGKESTSLVLDDVNYKPRGRPGGSHDKDLWVSLEEAIIYDARITKVGTGCSRDTFYKIAKKTLGESGVKEAAAFKAIKKFIEDEETSKKLLIFNDNIKETLIDRRFDR